MRPCERPTGFVPKPFEAAADPIPVATASEFLESHMLNYNQPDARGHFGPYGGTFVSETLI